MMRRRKCSCFTPILISLVIYSVFITIFFGIRSSEYISDSPSKSSEQKSMTPEANRLHEGGGSPNYKFEDNGSPAIKNEAANNVNEKENNNEIKKEGWSVVKDANEKMKELEGEKRHGLEEEKRKELEEEKRKEAEEKRKEAEEGGTNDKGDDDVESSKESKDDEDEKKKEIEEEKRKAAEEKNENEKGYDDEKKEKDEDEKKEKEGKGESEGREFDDGDGDDAGDDDDAGSEENVDAPQLSALLKAVLGPPRVGQLRAFVTREFGGGDSPTYAVGTFLTRVFDPALVSSAGGRHGAAQLMPYFRQASLRGGATLRASPGVVDVDRRALAEIAGGAVGETLLLVFNDWDHRARAVLARLEALAARLPLLEPFRADDDAADLRARLRSAGATEAAAAGPRRGAFAALWRRFAQSGEAPSPRAEGSREHRFFVWPRAARNTPSEETEDEVEPVQIIAAIRSADFDGQLPGDAIPFEARLQSPGLFFCSAKMRFAVPFTGTPSVEEMAEFVVTHTVSSMAIESAAKLKGVLGRFDNLALVLGDALVLEALLDTNSGAREGLRAVRPTFYVRAEELDVSQLAPQETQDLPPHALHFMFDKTLSSPPPLAPLCSTTQIVLLDRVAPGNALNVFTARAIRFPAPLPETNLTQWGKTVGARLVDLMRDAQNAHPFLRRVTALDAQNVFEQHMRMSYAAVQAQWRRPLLHKKTLSENSGRRLVVVVAERRGSCAMAAAKAAAKPIQNGLVRFVTTAPRGDFAAELRFIAHTPGATTTTTMGNEMCEVFVLDALGAVRRMTLPLETLRSGVLPEPTEALSPKSARGVSHPPPELLHGALRELQTAALEKDSAANELRSTRRMTSGSSAEWFLWLPPREPAPLVVHSAAANAFAADPAAADGAVQLLLLHDSSCGASANHLKAHRLLAECRGSAGVPLELIAYDLSELYWRSAAEGRLLRTAGKGKHNHVAQKLLFGRLEPFLTELHRLQPPQFVALNATFVVNTMGTTEYYNKDSKLGDLNGFAQSTVRMVSYMDSRIDTKRLLNCMQDYIAVESQDRKAFR